MQKHKKIDDAWQKLALECLNQAICENDFGLLRKDMAAQERLLLLCDIGKVDIGRFVERLKDKRKLFISENAKKKRRDYMREYMRRRYANETPEQKERRLASVYKYVATHKEQVSEYRRKYYKAQRARRKEERK